MLGLSPKGSGLSQLLFLVVIVLSYLTKENGIKDTIVVHSWYFFIFKNNFDLIENNEMEEKIMSGLQSDHGKGLQRKLQARHLGMISLGGAIGTGLFLASGNGLHSAGPAGTLIAYAVMGFMVYFIMTSLAEMATFMPVSGSFSTYSTKFVDPAFGFAMGWNYWYNWAITVAAELAAVALFMDYWFDDVNPIVWSAIALAIMFSFNVLSVKGFGEGEYWFAMIKIVVIVVFLGTSILHIIGILGGDNPPAGFANFNIGDGPFNGDFFFMLGVFMVAGFSFQGTELLGITAGEAKDPKRSIPLAIKSVFWRILLFYIVAIFVIALIIPYTDPRLAGGEVITSPFTLVFERIGIAFAASAMNAVLLTSVLSAGNSGLYAATRMLWTLAKEGKAPKFLSKLSTRGIPINALIASSLVGTVAFLTSVVDKSGNVYTWLVAASGMSGFIVWLGIAITHYRFRRAYVAQGRSLSDLPYRSKLFPFGPILAFVLCMVVIIGQFITYDERDFSTLLTIYIGLPLFIVLWLGYKFVKKTKVVPLEECDFTYEEGQ